MASLAISLSPEQGLSRYLSEIRKFPLLEKNEEFMLAQRWAQHQDAEAAERIKALMFTFDDMKRLDANGIQAVLRVADKDKIGIALKGAGDGIKELFFGNMSERAAKILREDMESLGPIKVRDVEDAQSYLVRIAKELADKGEIEIADSKGGEDLVY